MVRTYPVVKERIDQDLSAGNRGYLMGAPRAAEEKARKTTRQLQVFEVELYPIKVESQPPSVSAPEGRPAISALQPEQKPVETSVVSAPAIKPITAPPAESRVVVMKKYTIEKGDTLQSIAKKFYGTTKRWKEIYEANQEVLKSPNKIYPGQIIEIPVEEIPGTK